MAKKKIEETFEAPKPTIFSSHLDINQDGALIRLNIENMTPEQILDFMSDIRKLVEKSDQYIIVSKSFLRGYSSNYYVTTTNPATGVSSSLSI